MPTTHTPTRGYTATKDQLLARLKRIEGQIRGIEGMVTDDRRYERKEEMKTDGERLLRRG
jgi:hypothetical protein